MGFKNMGRIKDLTNLKFGRLTVLEDVGRKHGGVLWRCLCECGNTIDTTSDCLQSGHTQSCSCIRKEQLSKRSYKNLTGQNFGRLTVLEDVGRKHNCVLWRCVCECGNIVDVISNNLQSGNTKSCGCYHKERITETSKRDLTGQKFGRLTVLEDVGRSTDGQVIWRCLCDCGNMVDVRAGSLQKEATQSCGCLHIDKISGENSFHWKGGITPLNEVIRNSTFYKRWRTLVFQRDDFTCGHCLVRGGKLHAHHLNLFSDIMKEHNITTLEEALQCEALWDVSNGITLCKKCHKLTHKGDKSGHNSHGCS